MNNTKAYPFHCYFRHQEKIVHNLYVPYVFV